MLAEIIIYIALFAALFSGAFAAAFQTIDAVRYLQNQKTEIDGLYFLQARLDSLVQSITNWDDLSKDTVTRLVSGGGESVELISLQIIETTTSSSRVLLVTLDINKKLYTFSYVQEK